MFNSTWLKQNMSPGQVLPRSPQSVTWARLPNPAPQPILSKMDSNALKRNLITIAVVTSFSLSHKCQRGSGEWGLLILPKLAWRIPPKESNLILPGWLSHLPPLLLCPNCQWILVQIVSLVCDLHFCHYTVRLVLPSVWLIMGPEERSVTLTLVVSMAHSLPSSCPVECPSSSKKLRPSSLPAVCGTHRHLVAKRRGKSCFLVEWAKAITGKSLSPAEKARGQVLAPRKKYTQDVPTQTQWSEYLTD